MHVKAAVARAPDADFSVEFVELDEPRTDEILVRVVGVGICHSDLVMKTFASATTPVVLGHEGAGIVERVGSKVVKVQPGDRVAITFRACGHCYQCRVGQPAYCEHMAMLNLAGTRPDGSKSLCAHGLPISGNFFGQSSFASHCLTYESNVVKVPDDAPLEIMGPLGCGIQTGAGGIMRSLACEAGSSLLVLGGGAVGLSAVLGAVIQGCATIIVVEPHAARRALAIELGATHTLDPRSASDLAAAVRNILPQGVNYALDTCGIPSVQAAVMACLAMRGTFGIVAISPPATPVPGDLGALLAGGHRVQGIIEGDSNPDEFIPELIRLYRDGRFPFDKLVRTYPFEQINQAAADQLNGVCVKAVLLL
ncbi:MAG: NAD(P)-dependent alcohol dehydrogenase [Spongiibacteraceae bacterium]